VPLYLFSVDRSPPPLDFAVEHEDDAAAVVAALDAERELAVHSNAQPRVTVWSADDHRLIR
jgi:hypothetical protein